MVWLGNLRRDRRTPRRGSSSLCKCLHSPPPPAQNCLFIVILRNWESDTSLGILRQGWGIPKHAHACSRLLFLANVLQKCLCSFPWPFHLCPCLCLWQWLPGLYPYLDTTLCRMGVGQEIYSKEQGHSQPWDAPSSAWVEDHSSICPGSESPVNICVNVLEAVSTADTYSMNK